MAKPNMGVRILAALLAAFGAAGCGGESENGSGSCGNTAPCGGDVVGTWTLEQACMDTRDLVAGAFDAPECANVFQPPRVNATGTYEFRADGTMRMDVTFDMQMPAVLDAACIRALGGGEPSAEYCAAFATSMNDRAASDPTSTIESASCSFAAGACQCTMDSRPQTSLSEGAYTIQGDSFVDSDGDTNAYCVSGDTLRLSPSAGAGITGTIVLRRQ